MVEILRWVVVSRSPAPGTRSQRDTQVLGVGMGEDFVEEPAGDASCLRQVVERVIAAVSGPWPKGSRPRSRL